MTTKRSTYKARNLEKQGSFFYKTAQMLRTIRSSLGMFKIMLYKHTPLAPKENAIEDICNYYRFSKTLCSSGQPTQMQFYLIEQAGFTVVINLATHDFIESPLENEAGVVTTLGMRHVHIPVDFFNPTDEDFDRFTDAMAGAAGEKVWVHCAANARASSFLYRYRCSVLGENPESALWDLREIWEPMGPWKRFTFEKKS